MRENGSGHMVKQNGVEAGKTELCDMGIGYYMAREGKARQDYAGEWNRTYTFYI